MNVIVVGGGIAGICIGHQLDFYGIPFKIIDRGINYSTSVAGGMINPMTFRRLVKTWRCDEFIPFISKYYPEIEKKINQPFFFPIKIRKVHASTDEVNLWKDRLEDAEFSKYITPFSKQSETPDYIHDHLGSSFVNTPGYLDSKRFLEGNHHYFKQKENLIIEEFDFEKLDVKNQKYKNESFTHLIFAEGFQGEDNPFFNYLPFKNAKGETLTIKSDVLKNDEIINRKCFVLPTIDGDFKLGSTYQWNTKDVSPTEEGKEELLKLYEDLSDAPIEIINHEAGIRPTSADRRPLIGEHPEHKGIYIFNGLGAKGFTYAPYFATEFVEFLLGKNEIDSEVDIKRFNKKKQIREIVTL